MARKPIVELLELNKNVMIGYCLVFMFEKRFYVLCINPNCQLWKKF